MIPILRAVYEPGPVQIISLFILFLSSVFFCNLRKAGIMQSLTLLLFLLSIFIDDIILFFSIILKYGNGEIVSRNKIMEEQKKSHWFIIFSLLFYITIIVSDAKANNVKNSAVIFMYHKFGVSKYPTTSVTIEQFNNHVDELTKQTYNLLPLEFIVDTIINDGELPENTIGISVDDADRTFLEIAWPIYKEKKIPVTLFVNTGSINNFANNLNWDDIRKLKSEGVSIGAHSHSHPHMNDLSNDEMIEEIEKSNKIFLKEIGEIPNLFAYPYGEANNVLIDLIKRYKFKVAFGQHSGVINETSNLYYLPRFSLNEKYGDLERFRFISKNKGMGVYDFVPKDTHIKDNPPYIGFSLLDEKLSENINCFIFDSNGSVDSEIFKFNERIEIRLKRKINKGRTRLNCTAKDYLGNWRWFGTQFYN